MLHNLKQMLNTVMLPIWNLEIFGNIYQIQCIIQGFNGLAPGVNHSGLGISAFREYDVLFYSFVIESVEESVSDCEKNVAMVPIKLLPNRNEFNSIKIN